jgi:hypothetical protein
MLLNHARISATASESSSIPQMAPVQYVQIRLIQIKHIKSACHALKIVKTADTESIQIYLISVMKIVSLAKMRHGMTKIKSVAALTVIQPPFSITK